jgi:hypothetical protein
MKGPHSYFGYSPSLGKKILKLEPLDHPVKMVNYDERVKSTVKVYTTFSIKLKKDPVFFSPIRLRKQENPAKTKDDIQKMMLIPALSRKAKYFENKRFSV